MLVFANALHFKGEWKNKFLDPLYTKNSDFHLLNGTTVKAPFMTSQKETQYVRTFDGFKVLRLSYKQGRDKERRFSMCIFLPDAIDGLSSLIGKLASQSGFLKGKLPRRKVRVDDFKIPKFKISFALEASTVLKELGVISPFTKTDADFTNMVDSPSDELYVANLYHKASIEVNEQGTEAAATSSWRAILECCPSPGGIDFVADHPFLFLIREDLTGTVLFIGQVLNPLDGAATSLKKEDLKAEHLARILGNDGEEEDEGDGDDDDKPKVPPKKKKRSRKD
ncbi:serpin-Z2B-like [Lotus japonicus]|uniref:serpin-Z2B-like n=1 Tax=Lotus japonicus TaxID=34305 RepID=UPI00258F1777|nr:serpin-Z2B-like [Lotus japonicus]